MPIEHPIFKDSNKDNNNSEYLRPGSRIKKKEFFRLITQALKEHGFNQTADVLEHESGIVYEESNIIQFRSSIINGDWKSAENLLKFLKIKENNYNECLFYIRQQKYLELLEKRKFTKALVVLRKELAPLQVKLNKLYELSSYLMYKNIDDIKNKINWSSKSSRSVLLNELQKYISPSLMIPKHRLETLVEQSLEFQESNCIYHNTNEKYIPIYTDHICLKEKMPNINTHILEGHDDEVWNVSFSPDGKFLASGSKDCTTIIWDITDFQLKYRLRGHIDAISNLYWSPNGKQILTCSNDRTIKLWDVMVCNN
ncbi:hypothetical protein PIROE2DRAFT_17198 [Piromyces sp. E2]|nr:hypothetical protein PIROE2DRAFT_17198 [Piromyces sp. E2]|eukprot:OUM57729.1 hypothetical protein PIROE2DRAFT_17198 [Piromyces sp. E2]